MTEEKQPEKQETLGEYLQRQRLAKDLQFEDILKDTKIPPKSLKAIETDDFGQLPADAFARGFYTLYAKSLGLDPQDILARFDRERTQEPSKGKFFPPSKQEKQVNTMAARPSMATGSTLGFSLVIAITAISLFCWYFSWNPATYLSEKLRSFQEPVVSEMQAEGGEQLSTAGTRAERPAIESTYFLTVDFLEDATITISIDEGLPEKEVYTKGSTRSWYASKSISLILPEEAQVELFFNGSKIELDQPQNGYISMNLP